MTSLYTARCDAMKEAGILQPESQEGKDFCTGSCPYDHCVIAEPIADTKKLGIVIRAKELQMAGYSTKEIAYELRIRIRTAQRLLEAK